MTELELMKHAKGYLDKLANGINPLDDSILPDTDVVNQVRISRCLFYVSDVLRQLIDQGGMAAAKQGKKLPFAITVEERDRFAFSTTPIPVSEIARRINDAVSNDSMKKFGYRAITDWLLAVGLLREQTFSDGKKKKYPTENGNKIGIFLEERTGQRGTYQVILYTEEAQHFLIDNIDAILEQQAAEKKKEEP